MNQIKQNNAKIFQMLIHYSTDHCQLNSCKGKDYQFLIHDEDLTNQQQKPQVHVKAILKAIRCQHFGDFADTLILQESSQDRHYSASM